MTTEEPKVYIHQFPFLKLTVASRVVNGEALVALAVTHTSDQYQRKVGRMKAEGRLKAANSNLETFIKTTPDMLVFGLRVLRHHDMYGWKISSNRLAVFSGMLTGNEPASQSPGFAQLEA